MQGCQLLDLLGRQAFEPCISRMGAELHLGMSEPIA
jgi:hypothetical protein